MLIYYSILLFVVAALFAFLYKDRRVDFIVFIVGGGIISLIAGLRKDCDIDYPGYLDMFDDTPTLQDFNFRSTEALYGENGYLLLNSLVKSIGGPFSVLVFFCALIAVGSKMFAIQKLASYRALALSLFCCLHFVTIEFIQMRWAIACGFVTLGIWNLYLDRKTRALVWIAAGVGCHYYSALYLVLFLIIVLKREWPYYVILVAGYLWALAFRGDILGYFLVDQSEIYAVKRYASYVVDPLSKLGIFSYLKISLFPVIYIFARLAYPTKCKNDRMINFLFKASFLVIAATLFVSSVPMFHYRAVVIADFLSILLVVTLIARVFTPQIGNIIAITLTIGLSWWYVLDVANYQTANRLTEYMTCFGSIF
jgi:hypothetical protein